MILGREKIPGATTCRQLLQNLLNRRCASVIHTWCNGARYWVSSHDIALPALIRLMHCRLLMGQ